MKIMYSVWIVIFIILSFVSYVYKDPIAIGLCIVGIILSGTQLYSVTYKLNKDEEECD